MAAAVVSVLVLALMALACYYPQVVSQVLLLALSRDGYCRSAAALLALSLAGCYYLPVLGGYCYRQAG